MAQIEKRKSGRWRARIRRQGHPDLSRSFRTKVLAERWAMQVEADIERGVFVDCTESDKTTLGQILQRYASEVSPTKKGAASEVFRIKALARHQIAHATMSALSGTKIAGWRDERLNSVSPSTVLRDLNLMGHVIETARREWGIAMNENPVRLVRKPRAAPGRERRLCCDEEERLLGYFASSDARSAAGRFVAGVPRNSYMAPITKLGIETAMRQSELAGLRWEYINFVTQVATLPTTKNGSQRSVPLSNKAVEVLRSLGPRGSGPVFDGVSAEAIKRSFIRGVKALNIQNLRFHDLRHEATSRLFEKGLNPLEVASCTGHKTLQMLKRYTHFSAAHLVRKIG